MNEDQGIIDAGVEDIAASLGIDGIAPPEGKEPPDTPPDGDEDKGSPPEKPLGDEDDVTQPPPEETPEEKAAREAAEAEAASPPPKSWAKETHEVWSKLPPEAKQQILHREEQMLQGIEQYREFYGVGKAMKEVITPYIPMIQSAGLDPAKAVGVLLQANYRLTNGPVEARRQAFLELGSSLGLIQAKTGQDGATPAIPPEVQARLDRMEQQMTQAQREAYESRRAEVEKHVGEFWKTHPYADEVAEDMAIWIKAGFPIESAYEKAVFANPATREKELARLNTEAKAKADAKSREDAEKAKKATAANVRGRDTTRSPTEPKGKFLDESSMMEDLRDIKSRAH